MFPGVPSKPHLISLLQSTPSTGHTFTNYFTLSFSSHSPFSLSLVMHSPLSLWLALSTLSLTGWDSRLSLSLFTHSLTHLEELTLSLRAHTVRAHSLRAHSLTHLGAHSLTHSLGGAHSLTPSSLSQSSLTYSLRSSLTHLEELTHSLRAHSLRAHSLRAHSLT